MAVENQRFGSYVDGDMLEDRDYMRRPAYRDRPYVPQLSYTVMLIIVNVVVFLVECIAYGYPLQFPANGYFMLSLAGLKHGYVWQLLTYQFMHAGFLHIFLNCWVIYVFGRAIEDALGGKTFLALFLSSGVVGGLFQMLGAWIWPFHFGGAVVGASAGAMGLVAAFAVLFPERELTLLLFFILPLQLTAKMLLALAAAVTLVGLVFPFDHIANAAHLGGMVMGILYVRQIVQGRWRWPQRSRPTIRILPRRLVNVRSAKSDAWRSAPGKPDADLSTDEFLKTEVDPILDKISAHGIQSLTAREREILEKARSRMAKH